MSCFHRMWLMNCCHPKNRVLCCGVSHDIWWGAQGASRAAPEKSGLHACGQADRVIALESWEGLAPPDAFKKDSRGLSWVAAGNPRFPRLLQGTIGNLPGCLWEVRNAVELAGPLGTLLGSAQWKRASSRGEAGTSGFLSDSDSDCTVPAVLGQESHASSCLRNGILVASRVVPGVSGPLSSCV